MPKFKLFLFHWTANSRISFPPNSHHHMGKARHGVELIGHIGGQYVFELFVHTIAIICVIYIVHICMFRWCVRSRLCSVRYQMPRYQKNSVKIIRTRTIVRRGNRWPSNSAFVHYYNSCGFVAWLISWHAILRVSVLRGFCLESMHMFFLFVAGRIYILWLAVTLAAVDCHINAPIASVPLNVRWFIPILAPSHCRLSEINNWHAHKRPLNILHCQ